MTIHRNDRYCGALSLAMSGPRSSPKAHKRFDSRDLALRPILEVIHRTGECADTDAIRRAMAFGYVVERNGRLVLTDAGRRMLR